MFFGCNEGLRENTKPNILWIFLEDTSPPSKTDSLLITTPNIDKLAQLGVRFQNAIMPAPVCSASRSSIITGMMSTTLGLHNHHSSRTKETAIYLPDSVKTVPEVFKQNGYFTFNNGKDDYNFWYNRKDLYNQECQTHPLYGKKGKHIKLEELKDKQPFFGQIQLYGGKEIFSDKFKDRVVNPVDRSKIVLPPYLPNDPAIIEEYANHLDAIQITDNRVGQIIDDLIRNGLLENTIVFFFSDHGMRLTRHKQFLYEGGIKVPFIVADFTNSGVIKSGSIRQDLIGGIDLGPTSLGLAGIEIPTYMEGRDIFDPLQEPREYVISTRDRCDFTIDRIRSVRSKDYKYIKNFMIDKPYTQPTYMDVDQVEFVSVMKELYSENKLNPVQSLFFLEERPVEELYNLKEDPFEINNLAKNPGYAAVLVENRGVLEKWIKETDDKGQYPESEEQLKFMYGIWGKRVVNSEYDAIRKKYKDFEGSLFGLKSAGWKHSEEK